MSIEAILQRFSFLSTGDYRDSTITGTTRMGPNGSAQFLAMRMSTLASLDQSVGLTTADGQPAVGILQNKPSTGAAADVAIFGVSKVVAGTTTISYGIDLMADTSGCMIAYSSAAGKAKVGRAMNTPTAIGEVFSALLYGAGNGGGSIA